MRQQKGDMLTANELKPATIQPKLLTTIKRELVPNKKEMTNQNHNDDGPEVSEQAGGIQLNLSYGRYTVELVLSKRSREEPKLLVQGRC